MVGGWEDWGGRFGHGILELGNFWLADDWFRRI